MSAKTLTPPLILSTMHFFYALSYVVDTRKAIIELEKKTKFVKEKCFECNVFRRARSIEIALLLDPIGNLKRNNNLNALRD